MMKIVVGSTNPAKVHAVQDILIHKRATIVSVNVDSGVQSQPLSEEETMTGAHNRAINALKKTNAQLSFGLEGGVTETKLGLMLCNWGVLRSRKGNMWVASGAKIILPDHVAAEVKEGKQLGEIIANIVHDKKQAKKQGAVGLYTAGWVNRKELFA